MVITCEHGQEADASEISESDYDTDHETHWSEL